MIFGVGEERSRGGGVLERRRGVGEEGWRVRVEERWRGEEEWGRVKEEMGRWGEGERRRGGEGDRITLAAVISVRLAMVPEEHRGTSLSGGGKHKSDFLLLFFHKTTKLFVDIKYCLGKTSKKKTIIYPPLVDKGFPPPPLSTAIKVSVITLRIFFIHRRAPQTPNPKPQTPNPLLKSVYKNNKSFYLEV